MEIKRNGYYRAVAIMSYVLAALLCVTVAVFAILAMVDSSLIEGLFYEIMFDEIEYYAVDAMYLEAYTVFKSMMVFCGIVFLGLAAYTFVQAAYFMKYSKLTSEQAGKYFGKCLAWSICATIFTGWFIGLFAFLGLFLVQRKQKNAYAQGDVSIDEQTEEEVTVEKLEQIQIRLSKLNDLKVAGTLTDEEYAMMRDRIMADLHLEKQKTEVDVTTERLNKLNELKENGSISDEEYEKLKEKILKK